LLVHVEYHLVHDGWSFNVFLRELVELYNCFVVGRPSPLPELPIQFADFAHWQRQWMQGKEAEIQLAYWKKNLANSSPLLELPYDRPRPVEQTYRGAAHRIKLPISLCKSLQALSRQEGTTLFMTMLAAFVTMLHRYTQQEDINVGSSIANRRLRETEGLIGMIVNTFVLRNDISGNPTFCELLNRVRQVTLEAYAHQDFPFAKVVEALQLTRNLSHNPLYQVMFSFHDSPLSNLELPGLNISIEEALSNGSAKFDLSLVAIPRSEQDVGASRKTEAQGITLVWEYNTDLFNSNTITQMARCYQTLLEAIVAHPSQRVSDLPLLSAVEQRQLLVEWNNTQSDYPQYQSIHQMFEQQVERTPDAVAVVFENEQLTYQQLNGRANQLAHYLQKLGVEPEVLIGICVERSVEMVVGLLGVLKAGGAYLPIDSMYPEERVAFMLQDAQTRVLLTQERLLGILPEYQGHTICLDADWETISQDSEENPSSNVAIDNLAYVIYTSGSTGKPKGVMLPHRAICNHMLWMQADFPLTETDKVLQKTPFSFDASVWEFYAPLLVGAQLVIARPGGHQDSDYLIQVIVEQQITTLQIVPTLLQMLLESDIENCKSLKNVFCGGEALTAELQERFFTHLNASLHNLYGPTETCIDATFWTCKRGMNKQIVPIGRPIANTQIYILDTQVQLVPTGVIGELHIGGAGLARGYLNRPELTAERFIPNHFSNEMGARMYKTRDLARFLPDGTIEYLSRIDRQIKIRGFRIELGEIEASLIEHPLVHSVAVIAREDIPGNKHLVAYVVLNQEQVLTHSTLRHFLKEKLPEYMVPNAFVMLESLPLSPNGKVDHRALPAPDASHRNLQTGVVAPRNPTEEILASIWSEVLGLQHLSVHDNFFELGGHSLLATQVISRLRQAFSVELLLHSLFKFPTVAELAEYLETLRWVMLAQQTPTPIFTTGDIREQGEI
jgi:amino acid adenylation domain-containing protein